MAKKSLGKKTVVSEAPTPVSEEKVKDLVEQVVPGTTSEDAEVKRKLQNILSGALESGVSSSEPIIIDPKTGIYVLPGQSLPKAKRIVRKRKPITSAPEVPFRELLRPITTKSNTGVTVHSEQRVVQWFNAQLKEWQDLPFVREEDDFVTEEVDE